MPTSRTSSEFRIEKLRRELIVTLTDGSEIRGDVFLRPVSRYRARPEEPVDMLNDAEPFFAIVTDGEARLVAKSGVARAVTTFWGDEDDIPATTPGIPVEVTMKDGSTCTGSIFPESRTGRPRLLDFLNAYRERFLPVVDARQTCLVNIHMIAFVREVA